MNNMALYFLVGVTFLAFAAAVASWLARGRAVASIKDLEGKLVAAEARLAQAHGSPAQRTAQSGKGPRNDAAKASRRANEADAARAEDLLALRRDLAHARDDAKKAKEEGRVKDAQHGESREKATLQLHAMREDVRRLVEQLREAEGRKSRAHAAPASAPAAATAAPVAAAAAHDAEALAAAKHQIAELKARIAAHDRAERALGEAQERARAADARLAESERLLARYREAATAADGKPLDPTLFLKWKDRAVEGRRMYQMMRQLRELSDRKLASYQEGVTRVCTEVLHARGAPIPAPSSGLGSVSGTVAGSTLAAGAPADAFLAAALGVLGAPPFERRLSRVAGPLGADGAAHVSASNADAPDPSVPSASSEPLAPAVSLL